MGGWRRGWTLLSVLLMLFGRLAAAQVATSTVQDTVYRADGTAAGGSVLVSWGAFTTASGSAVPAGHVAATIGDGGVLTLALAPNAGSTPMGSYYTAVFHLDDGTTSREYWVVPVVTAGGVTTLGAIRNQVLPSNVAMQTVSKAYVDTAIAAAVTGHPLDSSPYVVKTGDTMTGPLVLPADPVSDLQAADKRYVDAGTAGVTAGLGRKVDELPGTTQVVAQPVGTELEVNHLNGTLYAHGYDSGLGDGVVNALASADCAAGCDVLVDRTTTVAVPASAATLAPTGRVTDERGGAEEVTTLDAVNPDSGGTANVEKLVSINTRDAAAVKALSPGVSEVDSFAFRVQQFGLTGGNNLFPEQIEAVPYFKNTFSASVLEGTYNTPGQHVLSSLVQHCYGVGDCLIGSQVLLASGGTRDSADEGAHPFDLQFSEDPAVLVGTCSTGCATGSTQLTIAVTAAPGTEGEGRFLIDKNPAKTITTGSLIAQTGSTPFAKVGFSGTSFATTVFLSTAAAATSQATNIAPGTVSLPIATSGVVSGYATSTAALTATDGVACVADPHASGAQGLQNYEMAVYHVVDATHVRLTLNKVHASGATIAVGGLCGYGLEQTVDTVNGIRQVFPVVGSPDATDLYYTDAATPIVAANGSTSGYVNVSLAVVSIARSGNVVTVTTAGGIGADVNGLTLTVAGVADGSYNGSYVVTTTGNHSLTYANTGPNSTSSGGTLSLVTGGYVLYPMAEVLGVMNAATRRVDGTLRLAANTVAWAAGDVVEEPHYFQEDVYADVTTITQWTPRPQGIDRAGVVFQGVVGPSIHGWTVFNKAPLNSYLGNGGTHSLPTTAYEVLGPWQNILTTPAGDQALMRVTCNSHGCNKWNSTYSLFTMDSAIGFDQLIYQPQNSTAIWQLGGASYTFSPASFTASTINVGTLNAGLITGGVSGSAITSGTISAARLPVFGPSGTTHSAGIVPDPGATAGSTRYLREDGTFAVPAGSTLAGVSASVGGSALAAGACATGTAAVSGALVGSPVVLAASDGSLPAAAAIVRGAVTSGGTVTVQVCAVAAVTPAAVTYNVRVVQ